LTLQICPVCKKSSKEHSFEKLDDCYEKFLKSFEEGDQS